MKDNRTASERLQSHGIRCMGLQLLGSPGESPKTVLESLKIVDSPQLENGKVTVELRIYLSSNPFVKNSRQ